MLYDLGDFVDDYRVDARLRNDLGLLFLVDLDAGGPRRLEALPLKLEHCHTRLARGEDAEWITRRFIDACAELGTDAARARRPHHHRRSPLTEHPRTRPPAPAVDTPRPREQDSAIIAQDTSAFKAPPSWTSESGL